MRNFLLELWAFTWRQALACLFPLAFFALFLITKYVQIPGLYRYDAIFIGTIIAQALLLIYRLESPREAAVMGLFHALGLALEIFKTHPSIGSWSYPEPGYLKIMGVPLYGGFMYAAIASYMCQSWRLLDLRLTRYPGYLLSLPLCVGMYVNFFTHHFIGDYRWWLMGGIAIVFARTGVHFTPLRARRWMPLLLSWALIGFFVWIAEHVSTWLGVWVYPDQKGAWKPVAGGKITSWFMMVIVSFVIVAHLKHYRQGRENQGSEKDDCV